MVGKHVAIALLALGLLLVLASTYRQETRTGGKEYLIKVLPMSESSVRYELNSTSTYIRVSGSMPCDVRIIIKAGNETLGLNCTKSSGFLKVATNLQKKITLFINVENYSNSSRSASLKIEELGSSYPYKNFSILGYFLWLVGFIYILIITFRKSRTKIQNSNIK